MTLTEQYAHDYRDMAMTEEELQKVLEEFADEIRKAAYEAGVKAERGRILNLVPNRKPLVHDVNWAEGYNACRLTTLKRLNCIQSDNK